MHEISAQPYRRHGFGERENAGGDRGGKGSARVPGDEGGHEASVIGQGASRCHARAQLGELAVGGRLQRFGEQICSSGRWGMAAVLGLRSAAVGALADQVTTPDEPVWIANINAADQIVLSGSIAALERSKAASRLAGARRWEALEVTIASHCPLQKPTAERMAAHLARLPRRPQRVAYLTNTGGRRVRADSAAVLDDLAQAVARPVQWYDAMRLMPELGATCAVQMPPGHALAALVAGSAPSMYALALEDDGIERAVAAGAAI